MIMNFFPAELSPFKFIFYFFIGETLFGFVSDIWYGWCDDAV